MRREELAWCWGVNWWLKYSDVKPGTDSFAHYEIEVQQAKQQMQVERKMEIERPQAVGCSELVRARDLSDQSHRH